MLKFKKNSILGNIEKEKANEKKAKQDNSVSLKTEKGEVKYVPKRYDKLQKDEIALILAVIIPQIILTCIFYIYVNFSSISLAFTDRLGNTTINTLKSAWNELFDPTSNMGIGLINTLLFFVKDNLMLFFQLFICYFFYKKIVGTKVFQIIFYLPLIISGTATVIVFQNVIDPLKGSLGAICNSLGIEMPNLLGLYEGAEKFLFASKTTWAILIYSVWTGWAANMLLLSGALARIPVEVLESARLPYLKNF